MSRAHPRKSVQRTLWITLQMIWPEKTINCFGAFFLRKAESVITGMYVNRNCGKQQTRCFPRARFISDLCTQTKSSWNLQRIEVERRLVILAKMLDLPNKVKFLILYCQTRWWWNNLLTVIQSEIIYISYKLNLQGTGNHSNMCHSVAIWTTIRDLQADD